MKTTPKGWQLVPQTLTEEMIKLALNGTHLKQPQFAQALWNDALRAAPDRPKVKRTIEPRQCPTTHRTRA
jgi:hypothetical protein